MFPLGACIGGFSKFFAISACDAHFKRKIAPKWLEIDQDNLHMKFLPLNVEWQIQVNFSTHSK